MLSRELTPLQAEMILTSENYKTYLNSDISIWYDGVSYFTRGCLECSNLTASDLNDLFKEVAQ